MRRQRGFASVVLVFAVALGAATASPASSSEESAIAGMINRERADRGIRSLTTASDLVAVARRHSQRMANDERIYHNDRVGSEVDDWTVLGENVGVSPTAEKVHDAFMDSRAHRVNILDTRFTHVGVGAVRGDDGLLYVTEIFVRRAVKASSSPKPTARRRAVAGPRAEPAVSPPSPAPAPRARQAVARPPRTLRALLRLTERTGAAVPYMGGVAGI